VTGLAFSTLGCPGVALDEVIGYAVGNGCGGVELRYAEGEPVHPGLSTAELAATGERLSDAGVVPLALASYIRVAAEATDDEVVADLRRHLEAAQALGARYIRVFPGGGEPSPAADARAARRLAAVADAAAWRPTTRTAAPPTAPASSPPPRPAPASRRPRAGPGCRWGRSGT
jgi:sugar phosphate isomerase/epimerase